jgi:hypothetical protein
MDPLLGDHHARTEALSAIHSHHFVLYQTRNGQKMWEGPYVSQEGAEGKQRMLLAPESFVVSGRVVSGQTVVAAYYEDLSGLPPVVVDQDGDRWALDGETGLYQCELPGLSQMGLDELSHHLGPLNVPLDVYKAARGAVPRGDAPRAEDVIRDGR